MSSQKSMKELKLNKLFTNIDQSVINSIYKPENYKKVNEGSVIYRAGQNSNELFLLLRGEVKIKFPSHSYISNKIFNDFFGEKELFDETRRNSSAVANKNCILYVIQKHIFETLITKSKTILENIETFGELIIPEVNPVQKNKIDLTKSVKPRLFKAIFSREERKEDEIDDASTELENEIIIEEDEDEAEAEVEAEATAFKPEKDDGIVKETSSLLKEEPEGPEQIDSVGTQRLLDVISSINQHFKIYDCTRSIVEELRKLTSSEAGEIYLIDKQSSSLYKLVNEKGKISSVKFKYSKGLTGKCALEGEIINIENPAEDSNFIADIDQSGEKELNKMIYLPLLVQSKGIVGVLQLARKNQAYLNKEIEHLELVTKHAALAIERCNSINKLIEMEKQESIDNIEKFLTDKLLIPIGITNYYTSQLSKESFSKKIKEMIALIKNQTNFIWDIFQSIFYYNKNDFFLNCEKININYYMNSIIDQLSDYCSSRNITLYKRTGDDTEITIDSGKLFMAVFLIIENACNVSKEGSKVFISSAIVEDYVQINVIDEGPGVNKELTESIFTAGFSKSKGRNRLGLPIAKRIVGLHSGKISFSNNSNVGSTFTISIPVSEKTSDKLRNNASESDSTSEELKTG